MVLIKWYQSKYLGKEKEKKKLEESFKSVEEQEMTEEMETHLDLLERELNSVKQI